jgi:hypothetical protein
MTSGPKTLSRSGLLLGRRIAGYVRIIRECVSHVSPSYPLSSARKYMISRAYPREFSRSPRPLRIASNTGTRSVSTWPLKQSPEWRPRFARNSSTSPPVIARISARFSPATHWSSEPDVEEHRVFLGTLNVVYAAHHNCRSDGSDSNAAAPGQSIRLVWVPPILRPSVRTGTRRFPDSQ